MIEIIWDKKFEKKLFKFIKKRPLLKNKIKEKLSLFTNEPYSPKLKNHKLSGRLKDLNAISIDYDCRIIFKIINEEKVLLIDIGTHKEVY